MYSPYFRDLMALKYFFKTTGLKKQRATLVRDEINNIIYLKNVVF